jgi:hypothetical protein
MYIGFLKKKSWITLEFCVLKVNNLAAGGGDALL